MNIHRADYMQLSIAERIQLVEDIWDSIAAESPEALSLSDAQRAELHRRATAHQENPVAALSWDAARSRLFPHKA